MKLSVKQLVALEAAVLFGGSAVGIGFSSAQEVHREALKGGHAVAVTVPAGSCALRSMEFTSTGETNIVIDVTYPSQDIGQIPSSISVITLGSKATASELSLKGGPGSVQAEGMVRTEELLNTFNPAVIPGVVIVEGQNSQETLCGGFTIVPVPKLS